MQYSTQKRIKQEILKKEVKQSIAEGMTKEVRHRPKCPMETILDFFLVIKKAYWFLPCKNAPTYLNNAKDGDIISQLE